VCVFCYQLVHVSSRQHEHACECLIFGLGLGLCEITVKALSWPMQVGSGVYYLFGSSYGEVLHSWGTCIVISMHCGVLALYL
jgi:hypothetical protein